MSLPEAWDEDRDGPDPDWIECVECSGEGYYDRSNCIDDLCHGGDVPCMHGDDGRMSCNICHGAGGWKREPDDHGAECVCDACCDRRAGNAPQPEDA